MHTVYLSLGSNLGDRQANLDAAIAALGPAGVEVRRVSPIYETEPVGFAAQQWFLNLVLEAGTALMPLQLLKRLQRIENALGRRRALRNGPRTIDIDILLFGTTVVRMDELEIPHPRMLERRFVLAPLADLEPELRHPLTKQSIANALAAAPAQRVTPR